MSKLDLKGIFPPIITNFDEDGRLDLKSLQENISRWNKIRLAGYVVFGSNGEYPYLTEKEKLNVLKAVVEAGSEDKIIIAGSGCEATNETIEMTRKCAKVGADAALIITPSYFKGGMSETALYKHYSDIADSSEIPIIIYNVPKFTGLNISLNVVEKLSGHFNIIGIKDSTGNISQLSELILKCDKDFSVMAGTANLIYSGLLSGAKGFIAALANICPKECITIYDMCKNNQLEEAKQLQLKMIPVNNAVTAKYGVPGLKKAMDMLGYKGGFPRRPLLPLDESKTLELKEILQEAGLVQ